MEFDSPDSPEVAKEFPGLYRADGLVDAMSDPAEYDEEIDKKKKKEKKDSKKDKGYAAFTGESSHDEDDPAADPKSPGKKNIIKSFKLSGKKKDKDKEKDKDGKKSDKDKKSEKEKVKKFADLVGRKSADKEMVTPIRIPFSAERHRSSVPAAFMPTSMTPKSSSSGANSEARESSSEKSAVSALNAFLNAPAPLFLPKKKDKEHKKEKDGKEGKKDKEHKKDKESKEHKKDKENKKDKDKKEHKEKKEHSSSVSKVKLKLMRSKNSLEDPHELHVSVSHQFPEDPESIAKEIRKYENLLEQNHLQIKSSKKVSKKQEEQLWELQRTLTQLKRKLRSINALSSASANFSLHQHHHSAHSSTSTHEETRDSVPPASFNLISNSIPPPGSCVFEEYTNQKPEIKAPTKRVVVNEELQLDFTLKSPDSVDSSAITSIIPTSVPGQIATSESPQNLESDTVETFIPSSKIERSVPSEGRQEMARESRVLPEKPSARRSLDFSEVESDTRIADVSVTDSSSIPPDIIASSSRKGSKDGLLSDLGVQPFRSESPPEREKVEVRVLVHNESREDSSSGTEEDPEEMDVPAISPRLEENIGTVVNDANAMIGSMHEEMEELAAALVFRQRKFSEDGKGHVTLIKRQDGTNQQLITKISKSEPTFGDQGNDSSDIELIREDEDELDEFTEDIIPELMSLPIFETEEYLIFENQELIIFNKKLQEDIKMEEAFFDELEELKKSEECINESDIPDSEQDLNEVEHWITVWQVEKSENEALHDNVSRLQQMVAMSKLEEFKLETRLRYLEDKVVPISPITITTPLQANDDDE